MLFYNGKREVRIGKYMGYFFIIQGVNYPCAYVKIPSCNKTFHMNYNLTDKLNIHGGITYGDTYYPYSPEETRKWNDWYIGWDYAHSGDAKDFDNTKFEGKYWTLEEITKDCKSVIEQLITIDAEVYS